MCVGNTKPPTLQFNSEGPCHNLLNALQIIDSFSIWKTNLGDHFATKNKYWGFNFLLLLPWLLYVNTTTNAVRDTICVSRVGIELRVESQNLHEVRTVRIGNWSCNILPPAYKKTSLIVQSRDKLINKNTTSFWRFRSIVHLEWYLNPDLLTGWVI